MPNAVAPANRPKRVRLKPEVRSRLILDAAMVEFGANGYIATDCSALRRPAFKF